MKPTAPSYIDGNVRAHCPDCAGAFSTFTFSFSGREHGTIVRNVNHTFQHRTFARIFYVLMRCGGCGRGGLATIHDNGQVHDGVLEAFYPISRETADLPVRVPSGVVSEYREAELCASVGAWRAGSALLRSALEKALRENGYVKGSLEDRINEAAVDGIITASRRQRAHDNVRDLGNDILHDEWRAVTEEEYAGAHLYVQRILEDLYDNRAEVEAILKKANRLKASSA